MTLLEPNRGLYKAIAPATLGGLFPAGGVYDIASPAAPFAAATYTVGALIRPIYSAPNRQGGIGSTGTVYGKVGDPASNFKLERSTGAATDRATSKFLATVSGTQGIQNDPWAGSTPLRDPEGPGEMEGLILSVQVVDTGAYPEDGWYLNGKPQDAIAPGGWDDDGLGVGKFEMGANYWEHIVGFFFHTDPMTPEEVAALQWNVQTAKDIPETDLSGLSAGSVPDHIWSVKRAMETGTNGVASWVSDGATGGVTLVRQDATLKVVEFDSQLAAVM